MNRALTLAGSERLGPRTFTTFARSENLLNVAATFCTVFKERARQTRSFALGLEGLVPGSESQGRSNTGFSRLPSHLAPEGFFVRGWKSPEKAAAGQGLFGDFFLRFRCFVSLSARRRSCEGRRRDQNPGVGVNPLFLGSAAFFQSLSRGVFSGGGGPVGRCRYSLAAEA
jgi:hypothetical protein